MENTNFWGGLAQEVEKSISIMKERAKEPGYVVESSEWVNVGKEWGIGGTEFTPKRGFLSRYAQVFPTLEEAKQKGADYYLQDKNGKPIEMIFTKADEFFNSCIERLEKSMKLMECLK